LYILLIRIVDYNHEHVTLFVLLLGIAPGIVFPLSTLNYKNISNKIKALHVALSVIVYISSYLMTVKIDSLVYGHTIDSLLYGPTIASMFGSFAYLTITKYLIGYKFKWKEIVTVSSFCGFIYFMLVITEETNIALGIEHKVSGPEALMFIWTTINGIFINHHNNVESVIPKEQMPLLLTRLSLGNRVNNYR